MQRKRRNKLVNRVLAILCAVAMLSSSLALFASNEGSTVSAEKAEAEGIESIKLTNPTLRDKDGYIFDQGNDGWYADPEIHYFEGKYWVYPTRSDSYTNQLNFDCFSSDDLLTWEKHESIIDMRGFTDVWQSVWAPTIMYRNGYYYILFGTNDKNETRDNVGGMFMARSTSPNGPFEQYMGANVPLVDGVIDGAQAIDAMMFLDDDGTAYLYYGGWRQCNMGVYNDDMTALLPIGENGERLIQITNQLPNFVEGVYMIKRENPQHEKEYYLMYSVGGWTDTTYGVEYARADSPMGPFEHVEGRILQMRQPLANGPGHHGILKVPGREDTWLMVYHRRPYGGSRDHRQTNLDIMEFNPDGTIRPIIMTEEWDENHPLNPNLAMIYGAAYSASSQYSTSNRPKFAFDVGISSASYWQSGERTAGQWLAVDFGSEQTFDNFEVYLRSNYSGKFKFQIFDEDTEDWVDITVARARQNDELTYIAGDYYLIKERTDQPVTASQVRMYFEDSATSNIGINEFEIYLGESGPLYNEEEPDSLQGQNAASAAANIAAADLTEINADAEEDPFLAEHPEIQVPEGGYVEFLDDFSADEFDFDSWRIREPLAEHLWEFDSENNKLVITGRGGDDYSAGNTPGATGWAQRNVTLTEADPYRNFDIYTEFSVDPLPYTNYMQSGLYVHYNQDNYMRLGRVYDSNNGGRTVEAAIELNGGYTTLTRQNQEAYRGNDDVTVNLKIEKRDMTFQAFILRDGEWISVAAASDRLDGYSNIWEGLEVGVYSTGANDETNLLKTSFDYFAIVDVGPANLREKPDERDDKPGEDQADGLRIYYDFNENVNNKATSGSYYNPLQTVGKVRLVEGVIGQGAQFYGVGKTDAGYLQLDENILNGMEEMTVSFWMRPELYGSYDWQRVWDFGNGQSNYIFFSQYCGNGGNPMLFRASSNIDVTYPNVPINQWVHITTTVEKKEGTNTSTIGKLYVNGQLVSQNTNFDTLERFWGTTTNYIGKSQYSDNYFNGTLDEFRIYNRALEAGEIADMADAGFEAMVGKVIERLKQDAEFGVADRNAVDKNLTLPSDSDLRPADYAMKVRWSSDKPEVIDPETGVVIRPAMGENPITVTLTAEVYKGSASATTSFELTVIPFEEEVICDPIDDVSTTLGTPAALPLVHSANNGKYQVNIVWENYGSQGLYSKSGLQVIKGTVLETGEAVTMNLIVDGDIFLNPVIPGGGMRGSSDPYVIQKDGIYYYVRAENESYITVSKTDRLEDIGQAGREVVWTPDSEEYGFNLRAPRMYEIDGKWYIYVSANDGEHQRLVGRTENTLGNYAIHVLQSDNPMGPFEYAGKITAEGEWAVDASVLQTEEGNYLVWSGKAEYNVNDWKTDRHRTQNLYIAEMTSPTEITERNLISEANQSWEINSGGSEFNGIGINEGPAVLINDDDIFIVYSANLCRNTASGLGYIKTKIGKDLLNIENWTKSSGIVFASNSSNRVNYLRQACFVKSPDGTEDWILYQANYHTSSVASIGNGRSNYPRHRSVRMQKFDWTENGQEELVPNFGAAVTFNSISEIPSGSPEGSIYKFEGEEAVGENLKTVSYDKASGGKTQYIWHDGYLQFNIVNADAGLYDLTLMGSAIEYDAEQVVTVNGKSYDVHYTNFSTYHNQFSPYRLTVELKDGNNTIIIENKELNLENPLPAITDNPRSAGAHVDYIYLKPATDDTKPGPDKSELAKLVEEAKKLKEEDYDEEIWAVFKDKLDKAEAILSSTTATQSEVDHAYNMLSIVMKIMDVQIVKPQKTILAIFIEAAKEAKASPEYQNVIPSVQATFETALDYAIVIYEKDDATYEEIMDAALSLLEELHRLGFIKGNRTYLQELYDLCASLNMNNYKDGDEKDDFLSALEAAANVLADPEAMDPELQAAYDKLLETCRNLIPQTMDLYYLEALVEAAKECIANEGKYVAKGFAELKEAVAKAEIILDKENPTDEEVSAMCVELAEILASLRYKADKSLLESYLFKAASMDLNAYTQESVVVLLSAMADAREVLNDDTLSEDDQDYVDQIAVRVLNAINALQDGIGDGDGQTDSDSEEPTEAPTDAAGQSETKKDTKKDTNKETNNNGKGGKDGKNSAKTGDGSQIMVMLLFVLLSGTSVVVFTVKKKRQR